MRQPAATAITPNAFTPYAITANNRPELALLLAIARVELTAADEQLLEELLGTALNWEYVRALAGWHGLLPLLFHHLNRHGAGLVPPLTLAGLRDDCRELTQRNLVLAARLLEVSEHLCSRRIEHVAFKGPLLAERYYGSCALRASHDLDLMVPAGRIEAARKALGEIGFYDKNGFGAAQQAASFYFGFEHPFTNAAGLALDLHWRVAPRFVSRSMDEAGLWRRVIRAPLFDAEVPSLGPEDELVALCLHAGQHEWVQISHYCDMAQLLQANPRLDWDIVRSHLGDSSSRHIVAVGLELLRCHWPVELPSQMLSMIASDWHAVRLAKRIQCELWPSPGVAPVQPNLGWLVARSAGEDFGDRLRLMLGVVLGPTLDDFAVFNLPRSLVGLYPALRAARLAYKYTLARGAPHSRPGWA